MNDRDGPPIAASAPRPGEPGTTPVAHVTSRGTALQAAANLLSFVSGYFIHVVSARVLGPVSYGRFVVVLTILLWVQRVQLGGIATTYGKLVSEDHRHLRAVANMLWRISLPIASGLALLLVLLSPLVAHYADDRALIVPLLIGASHVVAGGLFGALARTFQGLHLFGRSALLRCFRAIGRAGLILLAVLVGLGPAGAVTGHALGTALAALAGWLLLRRFIEPAMPRRIEVGRRLLDVGLPALLVTIGLATLSAADLWTVSGLEPSKVARGTYAAGYQLASVTRVGTVALAYVIFARLSALMSQGRLAKARSIFRQAQRVYLLAMVPLVVLMAVSGPALVRLVLSRQFAGAGGFFAVLFASVGLWGFAVMHAQVPIGANRAWQAAAAILPLVAAGPVLMVLGYRGYGLIGTAWAALATGVVAAGVLFAVAWRHLRACPQVATLVRTSAAAGAIGLVSAVARTEGWLLVLQVLALLAGYGALLWLLREFDEEDRRALAAVFSPLRRKARAARGEDEEGGAGP